MTRADLFAIPCALVVLALLGLGFYQLVEIVL